MRRFSERNYYAVLGVLSTADRDQIKAAYRNLVRTAHPDRGGSSEHFALISEAWEVLGDEAIRENYDAERRLKIRAQRPYMNRLDGSSRPADGGPPNIRPAAVTATSTEAPRRERYSDEGLTDAQRWRRDKRRL